MKIASLKKIGIPKYKQIIASIEDAIVDGTLKKGDKLPSLNVVKERHKLSRDTVLTAFNELKNRGIIYSIVGKGYFVNTEDIVVKKKIFLLFDELNSFKEDLYNSFLTNLGDNVQVDIFFHHFNIDVFNKLINDNIGNYSNYVIMPANLKNVNKAVRNLPKEKVYILDQDHSELREYPVIFQNFEKDIFNGLSSGLEKLKNYKKIILLYKEDKEPKRILSGFELFSNTNNLNFEVISSIENRVPQKGEVYLILDDKNLIRIIKKIKESSLQLSKDVGLISFNDTLLKEVVADGITTISTDFNFMGEQLAKSILNNKQLRIENPSKLILRNSL